MSQKSEDKHAFLPILQKLSLNSKKSPRRSWCKLSCLTSNTGCKRRQPGLMKSILQSDNLCMKKKDGGLVVRYSYPGTQSIYLSQSQSGKPSKSLLQKRQIPFPINYTLRNHHSVPPLSAFSSNNSRMCRKCITSISLFSLCYSIVT